MKDRAIITTKILKKSLEEFDYLGSVLVVENYEIELNTFLANKSSEMTIWNRYFSKNLPYAPYIKDGEFDTVIIRLPKSHAYFDMILNTTAKLCKKNAKIIVFGMTDEGIKGAKSKMKSFFGNIETIFFKKRCHIIASEKISILEEKFINDFIIKSKILYDNYEFNVNFYPGMFCAGKLDLGTKILIDSLRNTLKGNEDILDYGCGSGIIGVILNKYFKSITYSGLDIDSISLLASKSNLPNSDFILANSLESDTLSKYDLILSNPPMHTEKREHIEIIVNLIKNSPKKLKKNGKLIIVVQSRLNLKEYFDKYFKKYNILKKTNHYTVYIAQI